jgi:DNA repair photolyase
MNTTTKNMNGKPVLWREAKTVVTFDSKAFQEKGLCDGITINTGDSCKFSCSFCYVGSQMWKLDHELVKSYNKEHSTALNFEDVVIRRKQPLEVLKKQILDKESNTKQKYLDKHDNRVVYSSTLVDVAANMELLRETAEWVNFILDKTFWQIRLLTKSSLLYKLVEDKMVPDKTKSGSRFSHHQRLIFGFSTGTLNDDLANAFEKGTARVSKRIEGLHWLQDRGFRTFGMICPSLPQENYETFSKQMCDALRPEKCEKIWAEVINVRGESFKRTYEALLRAGFKDDAERLKSVSDSPQAQQNWEQYARQTFEAHAKNLSHGKLRFLQYVDRTNATWWGAQRNLGAVLLGKYALDNNLCLNEPSAPAAYYE